MEGVLNIPPPIMLSTTRKRGPERDTGYRRRPDRQKERKKEARALGPDKGRSAARGVESRGGGGGGAGVGLKLASPAPGIRPGCRVEWIYSNKNLRKQTKTPLDPSWLLGTSVYGVLASSLRDFPGGPVAKTPCSQCRGPEFNPWSGN